MANPYKSFGIGDEIASLGDEILKKLKKRFEEIDDVRDKNFLKVLSSMQKNRVSASCFITSTGYGYNDLGRDTLESVYASCFSAEAALVRPQITCGTHALTIALSANLLPNDELLCPVGKPYDTLEGVIGINPSVGSLAEYGVTYKQVDLLDDGGFDYDKIASAINPKTKLVEIQRSRGYQTRPTLSVERIAELIKFVKGIKNDIICMVDNCYGEFVQLAEPSQCGADLTVGSLIKNPGGGLAPSGGYICGRTDLIERCAYRLNAPGLGREVGSNFGIMPAFYQGLYMSPYVTAAALKTAIFAAHLFDALGFDVFPLPDEPRYDIIQSVIMKKPELLIAFCEGIQAAAPVDSFAAPIPAPMPGYDSDVIMAAGAFIQGSSIELSADGPLREPYTVYFQGGLVEAHGKIGILKAAESVTAARRKIITS